MQTLKTQNEASVDALYYNSLDAARVGSTLLVTAG